MATVPTPIAPVVNIIDGTAVTTSLALADYFGKRHDNVIAKIHTLDCSPEFRLLNFKETVYNRPNPAGGAPIPTPCYLLTRDGFFFVAMGFTGRRAAEFKEAYIDAFNAMEQQLANRPEPFALMLSQIDADGVRDSLWRAMQCMAVIREVWDAQLYDGLKMMGSPLAVSLHEWIAQGYWSVQVVARATDLGDLSDALAAAAPRTHTEGGAAPTVPFQQTYAPARGTTPPPKPATKASRKAPAMKKGGRRHDY